MNTKAVILLTLFTPTVLSATPPTAPLQLDTGLIITPFAVPVAILNPAGILYRVAPFTPVYSQPNDARQHSLQPAVNQQLQSEFNQFQRWKQSRANPLQPQEDPQSQLPITAQIKKSCLQCHAGTNPKGDLSLDTRISQPIRLQAIRAIITGKMPPQSTLTPVQRGQLLLELATPTGHTPIPQQHTPQSPGTPQ